MDRHIEAHNRRPAADGEVRGDSAVEFVSRWVRFGVAAERARARARWHDRGGDRARDSTPGACAAALLRESDLHSEPHAETTTEPPAGKVAIAAATAFAGGAFMGGYGADVIAAVASMIARG